MGSFKIRGAKDKVVFVMGATGTGKSRLAIDLALRFGGEIVNSDKMQVYDGLAVVTNKVTDEECMGIPHHLLGCLPPDADFTTTDFREEATRTVESIIRRGRLPIVAGGSNSYVEELVEGNGREFRRRFKCCFLWVDVQQAVLHRFVAQRVDGMMERGLVEEVRALFDPDVADYSRGIRRAIGVPEMDCYLRADGTDVDAPTKATLLQAAVDEIKANTCKLTCCQRHKINRLSSLPGWRVRKVDATEVFTMGDKAAADEAWEATVAIPSVGIVTKFLEQEEEEEEQPEAEHEFAAIGSSMKKGTSLVVMDMVKVAPMPVGATV